MRERLRRRSPVFWSERYYRSKDDYAHAESFRYEAGYVDPSPGPLPKGNWEMAHSVTREKKQAPSPF